MYALIKDSINRLLKQGHERTRKANRHILYSLLVKGGNILVGFMMVPLTISYISEEQYGIWLTLSSIVLWFSFFDFGLGNGLRNKLGEAMANNDIELSRIYVSSAYAIIGLVSAMVFLVFLIINPFLNWSSLLHASESLRAELSMVAFVVFSFFCLSFVLKLIYMIFTADQKPSMTGLFNFVSNLIALIIIFILIKTTEGSLLHLALALGLTPVVVLLFANVFFFSKDYKKFAPSIKYVQPRYFKDLISLGMQFFFIEIAVMILYMTDNVIISQIFTPKEVVPYNIAYKYFSLAEQGFAILCMPFWSAFTEAYIKKEMDWIRSTLDQLYRYWRWLILACVFMVLGANLFYYLWVPEISVPILLSVCMALFVAVNSWGRIHVSFINGISKVRLELWLCVFVGIINIPLSVFFAKNRNMGTAGVIFATFICALILYGVLFIQHKKIINNTATGIWNR